MQMKVNDAAWPTQLSHSAQLEYETDSYTVGLSVACLQPSIHLGPAEQVRRLWIMDSHPPAAISGSADCSVTRLKSLDFACRQIFIRCTKMHSYTQWLDSFLCSQRSVNFTSLTVWIRVTNSHRINWALSLVDHHVGALKMRDMKMQDRKLAQKRQMSEAAWIDWVGLLLRLEYQTAEEENESDVLATHQNIQNKTKQNMRFTVRLRIVYTASAPQRRHNESSTYEEDDADDLPSATCCSDWYDFHVSSDTGSSCRQLLWGDSDQATRRRRTCLLRPRSFLQAPAARFVALISRWRCVDWN